MRCMGQKLATSTAFGACRCADWPPCKMTAGHTRYTRHCPPVCTSWKFSCRTLGLTTGLFIQTGNQHCLRCMQMCWLAIMQDDCRAHTLAVRHCSSALRTSWKFSCRSLGLSRSLMKVLRSTTCRSRSANCRERAGMGFNMGWNE